jgi:hypothetical protein
VRLQILEDDLRLDLFGRGNARCAFLRLELRLATDEILFSLLVQPPALHEVTDTIEVLFRRRQNHVTVLHGHGHAVERRLLALHFDGKGLPLGRSGCASLPAQPPDWRGWLTCRAVARGKATACVTSWPVVRCRFSRRTAVRGFSAGFGGLALLNIVPQRRGFRARRGPTYQLLRRAYGLQDRDTSQVSSAKRMT